MRKTIYNIFSLLIMASVLQIAVSCEEPNPVDNVPAFPELVEQYDVEPGTELTLTIQPNSAWSISIPKQSYEHFKIQDGKFKVQTISGISSDSPITVTIWTNSEESFAIRSCDVQMTMKGQTQTIAKYTLRAKDRTVEVYKSEVNENGDFVTVEGGGYSYNETAITSDDTIELLWDSSAKQFYFPVKVLANYKWTVLWPEWARADLKTDSRVGETCFEIYAVASKLPMEDAVGQISFMNGEQVMKSFNIKLPGCKDIFDYKLGSGTSVTFDHAAYAHTGEGSSSKDPLRGFIYGPSASRVVVLQNNEGIYSVAQEGDQWLNVTMSSWDNVEGASVLQERDISVSAPKYIEKVDREAIILFLPATAPESVDDLLTADKTAVRDEYASYAIPVTQTACPDEYFTFESTQEEREASGLLFSKAETEILPELNLQYVLGSEDWQYDLSYEKDMASAKSTFYLTYQYETYEVYDEGGIKIPTDSIPEHWLRYNPLSFEEAADGTTKDGFYGQVLMDMGIFTKRNEPAPEKIDGYIVFKDEVGKVLAAVHCFYVAEIVSKVDVYEDAAEKMFSDPAAASAAGATIHEIVAGPTYEKYKEQQAPIYVLKYTKDNTSLDVKTSKRCQLYTCVAKPNGPEMVTVDKQIYNDQEFADMVKEYLDAGRGDEIDWDAERSTMGYLRYGKVRQETRTYNGVSEINMTMPEPAEGETKATVYQEVIQFATTDAIQFIFICQLDLTSTLE